MSRSQPAQDLAGVRTWVTDSRENTPAPSESRQDYADGSPKRDRVLPLPSGHPEGREENRAGPPVSNTPPDSSGASTSYSKRTDPSAIPNQPEGKPLHQRPRSSGLPGDAYGHPYIDQSQSTGLKRRVAVDALMDEVLDSYLDEEDYYYDLDEHGELIKVALVSVSPPKKRQRKQKGEARREYKKRRLRFRMRNKTRLKMKRRKYYLRNRNRIKLYNKRRKNNPNRYKRFEGGGASTIRQKNERARKAQDMRYYDLDAEGQLILKAFSEENTAEEMLSEEMLAYKKMNPTQKRKMLRNRARGSRNRPDRVRRRRRSKRNKMKIRRQQKMWRKRNKHRLRYASESYKLDVMQALLAVLRAVHWSHWTSHWQASGNPSYGDHLLFERLYEGVEDEIDTLAEKIVGEFGPEAVAPVLQVQQSMLALIRFDHPDPLVRALKLEESLQRILKRTYDLIKNQEGMSLGLDDYIMSIANSHETNLYLLRQRTRG